jgi:hypothetical protein
VAQVPRCKLGELLVVDAHGSAVLTAKKDDLVNGVTLRCTYTAATGSSFGGGFGGCVGRRRGNLDDGECIIA